MRKLGTKEELFEHGAAQMTADMPSVSAVSFHENALAGRATNALVLAGNLEGERKAVEAVECSGGRVVSTLSWHGAAARLGDQAVIEVLMIEAEGIETALVEPVLPRIDTLARATDARVVIAIGTDQIDLVTANLFGEHAQLLCSPTLSERVGALSLAGVGTGTRLNDVASDGEAERLRRLNDEVARIAQTLARLTRRESETAAPDRPAGIVGDRRSGYGAPPIDGDGEIDPQSIRQAIRARRLRDQYFEPGLFEDPAWDMLLDLFAAELEDRRVSVSSLCIAAAVAPTTALRWIGKMSEAGLLAREPDPFDRRRAFMALSVKAREGLRSYWNAMRKLGLAIA